MRRTVTIPTKWEDVTLRQYIKFIEAVDEECQYTQQAKIVAAFTKGLTYTECMNHISYAELSDLAGHIYALLNSPPPKKLKNIIRIDGVDYGFHPYMLDMSAGEFIDLTTLDKGFWKDADKAMAILYRPINWRLGKKYTIEPYGEKHMDNGDLMLDLRMDVVFGAAAFFLTLKRELETALMTYSEQVMKQKTKEVEQAVIEMQRELDGTNSYTTWQGVNS